MSIKRPKRVRVDLPLTVLQLLPRIEITQRIIDVLAIINEVKGGIYGKTGCAAIAYGISEAVDKGSHTQSQIADLAGVRLINLRSAWKRVRGELPLLEAIESLRDPPDEIAPIPE